MKKGTPYIIMAVGVILFCIGIFLQVPGKKLTTYSVLKSSSYSVIEEYVGGDAYNYIIGAALVGGEIAGAMTQKAIFVAVGLLIFCFGLSIYAYRKKDESGSSEQVTNKPRPLNAEVPDASNFPTTQNIETTVENGTK